MDNIIPVVGNLRRQLRENFNKPSLNIEKKKQKKGFIVEDDEESVQRAPSVENLSGMSRTVQDRIERVDSFARLQTRDQFRSISPEAPPPPPLPRKDEGGGLLVEVTDGKPLIYDQDLPRQSPDYSNRKEMKTFALDSPKNKGSEMGDSGISSNPASMSPHSSTSGSSSASPKAQDDPVPALLKKLVPPGGKKRDTMIRELKFKLKERFPEDNHDPRTLHRGERMEGCGDTETLHSQRAEVGPKLTKIFGALMSEAGSGPGQATLLRQQRGLRREEPQARNLGVPLDDIGTLRTPKLPTVKEFDNYHDSICPSIYDPSLPPGLEQHIDLASPPPPPPTQASSKRGSVLNTSYEDSLPSRPSSDMALDRREILYGPGGIFGPRGPFSTPGLSRYPEVASKTPSPRNSQPKSNTTSITEESGLYDGDRSDKSQYICNPVLTVPAADPFASSRLENYRARVSPESPGEVSREQVAALAPHPREVDRWVEEKQRRMISWVARGGQVRTPAT